MILILRGHDDYTYGKSYRTTFIQEEISVYSILHKSTTDEAGIDGEIYEWHSEHVYDSYTELQDLFGVRLDIGNRNLYP